ncbi:hypothetical protein GAY33_10070 [Azospirillum brasilense]|uniref:hypothetical protein n=1 Tax=Azospirillum argentinense TaxID=2970906 RepID=UPI001185BA17|nr:hypothetical protein [Azospirillum argentinense]MBK3799571.1 hypothetical protein [Azospirillum argentinense]
MNSAYYAFPTPDLAGFARTADPSFTGQVRVPAGAVGAPGLAINGDPDTGLFAPGTDTLALSTGGAERARVDAAGNLVVGGLSSIQPGTTPTYRAGALQVRSAGAGMNIERYTSTGSSPPALYLAKSNNVTPGWHGAVSDSTVTGEIQFHGSDGAKFLATAAIRSAVDGAPGTDDMPGRLLLLTTMDGGTMPTERMRISANGTVTMGATPGGESLRVTPVAAAVNTLEAAGAVSGAAPTLSVQGANADIDLKLSPKGAGHVRFGQYTAAGGLAVTGYVEIKDAGGVVRRLAIVN